jgi:hypothetical protein
MLVVFNAQNMDIKANNILSLSSYGKRLRFKYFIKTFIRKIFIWYKRMNFVRWLIDLSCVSEVLVEAFNHPTIINLN